MAPAWFPITLNESSLMVTNIQHRAMVQMLQLTFAGQFCWFIIPTILLQKYNKNAKKIISCAISKLKPVHHWTAQNTKKAAEG